MHILCEFSSLLVGLRIAMLLTAVRQEKYDKYSPNTAQLTSCIVGVSKSNSAKQKATRLSK